MRLLVTIFIAILLTGCKKESIPGSSLLNTNQVFYSTPINTLLALGDSYTIGESVYDLERFPTQTTRLLSQEGIPFLAPTYIASTGWTTSHLRMGIEYNRPEKHTIVTLLIGVNDQNLGLDLETYRQGLEILVKKAITLAYDRSKYVFMLSIPDYSVTPRLQFADTARISAEIDRFNEVNKAMAVKYQCNYLYITDLTKEARNDRSLIATDGLHPSGKDYERWARRLVPMIRGVLK